MAFLDLETSVSGGRPIAFYRFTFGSVVWRYVAAEEDITDQLFANEI